MQWLKDRALSMMLFAIGLAALGVTIAINRFFGVSQAATAEGQVLSGSISVIIDVALVALGVAAGTLLRSEGPVRKAIGALCFLLMLACALASVIAVLGFLGAERISVSKARDKQEQIANAKVAAQQAAEKDKLDAQIKLARENAQWMQGAANQKGMGKAERKEMRRDMVEGMTKSVEAIGKSGATLAPSAPVEVIVKTDEQVELIAQLIGINKSTAQLTILTYISILVIVLKSTLFPIGAYVWPRPAGLPRSVTEPIAHGLPDEAHVRVVDTGPALEPPPAQRMLPAPMTRPEPPPEGRAVLARIGFPKAVPEGEPRAMTDEERETVGIRLLAWMTAHGMRGDYAQDVLWALLQEHFAAMGVVPCAERIAKSALADVHKGKKYFATKTAASPVVWNIRLPDFEELNALLDRDGFPAAPKASRTKAEKVVPPTEAAKPQAEEIAPAPSNVTNRPFSSGTETPKPIKGMAELHRYRVDIDGMRSLVREQKRAWQAKMLGRDRKQSNRMRRARVA